jgi:predicted enzyme related to lactoylglutathione lyase
MSNAVIHWVIGGHEGEKLAWFYGELFGWTPEPAGEGYWLVPPSAPGIGGGLLQADEPVPPHVTIYVQVHDLESTLEHASLLGGKVVKEPEPIPSIGRFALFEDLEGNIIGLLETA